MNGMLSMLGMLLAGGVLAGLIAADIRRHQNRERAAARGPARPHPNPPYRLPTEPPSE